jgi:hypothetical protein
MRHGRIDLALLSVGVIICTCLSPVIARRPSPIGVPTAFLLSGTITGVNIPPDYTDGGTPSGTPGSRFGSAMTVDSNEQNAYLFGGLSFGAFANDLWKFSTSSLTWQWIGGSNFTNQNETAGGPGSRFQHACLVRQSDIYCFGGFGFQDTKSPTFMGDLWVYHTNGSQWAYLGNGGGASPFAQSSGMTQWPGWRKGHAFVYDPQTDTGLLFGGSGYGSSTGPAILQDMWKLKWNVGNNQPNWTYVSGSLVAGDTSVNYGTPGVELFSNQPGSRQFPAMASDGNGILWMYGGNGYAANNNLQISPLGDLWRWNISTQAWTFVVGYTTAGTGMEIGVFPSAVGVVRTTNATSFRPGARYGAILTVDLQLRPWVSSGFGFGMNANYTGYLNDTWQFNAPNWSWLQGSNTANNLTGAPPAVPPQLVNSTWPVQKRWMSAFAVQNDWYVYGGNSAFGNTADMWMIDLTQDHCTLNNVICLNGGTCVNTPTSFACNCPFDFFGSHCEFEINQCATNNGGCSSYQTCVDFPGGFNCSFCPSGFAMPAFNSCIPCMPGYFAPSPPLTSPLCLACPAGRFQPSNESNFCPACTPGTYSAMNASTNCTNCLPGTFQSNIGSVGCFPCLNGTFNTQPQATLCPTCGPGKTSYMMATSCFNCSNCGPFPCASSPCYNGANCTNILSNTQFNCSCQPGYSGKLCQTQINECASSPCLNGGSCTDRINGFTCACASGFTGTFCQTQINECASTPCRNGGTCFDLVDGFFCSCKAGFAGTLCQTALSPGNTTDPCASFPCQNGATCVSRNDTFQCNCTDSFSGKLCERGSLTVINSYTSTTGSLIMAAAIITVAIVLGTGVLFPLLIPAAFASSASATGVSATSSGSAAGRIRRATDGSTAETAYEPIGTRTQPLPNESSFLL